VKNYSILFGLAFLIVATVTALFAPWIAPYPYDQQDMSAILHSPDQDHLLGTDSLGRDLLSRMIYGARVSLFIPRTRTTYSAQTASEGIC